MRSLFLFGGVVIIMSAGVLVASLLELARLGDGDSPRPRRRHRSRLSLRWLRSGASESLRRRAEPSAWAITRDLTE